MKDVPPHDKLMWPTLEAVGALGGSGTNNEIVNKVIELLEIPERVQKLQNKNDRRSKLEYRLAWARTYLKLGGALENSARGVWSITDVGERVTEADIPEIVSEIRLKGGRNRGTRKITGHQQSLFSDEEYFGEIVDDWKSRLVETITDMTPDAFERLAQRLLRESGFKTVEVTGRSGDGGIDGTGVLQINLITFPVAFQCKKYKGSVGAPAIRDFRGAIMGRCEKGLLITTGSFTVDAQREATRDGALAIDLVDGDRLCDLLKELSLGVKTKIVEKISVDDMWFKQI